MRRHFWRVPSTARALPILAAFLFLVAAAAMADEHHDVHGTVTARDGTPIAGAGITLSGGLSTIRARSDRRGRFELKHVKPGTYLLAVAAPGYGPIQGRTVDVTGQHDMRIALVLDVATTNSLTVIGDVRTNAGSTVSTSSAPSVTVNAQTAAAHGTTEVSDMLWGQMGTTPALAVGGGSNAIVSIAVRGPDPTETLVDIDGHQVNNGNTGDFDLSLLDPAALADVQVVYGISPSSLIGPNTLGGAVNVLTLQPSAQPQTLLRGFLGSFGSTGQTLQTTGTSGRFGYAASLHRATSLGSVNQSVTNSDGDTVPVGSAFFGETLLSKLRYQLGSGYGYVQLSVRDQAVNEDLSSLLTNYTPPGFDPSNAGYQTFQGTSLASHQANYGVDAVLPLGPSNGNPPSTTLSYSHLTALAQQSVNGPGAQTSPYLYDQRDAIGDDWLQISHRYRNGDLSLKYDVLTEDLTTQYVTGSEHANAIGIGMPNDAVPPGPTSIPLAQTQRYFVARYDGNPSGFLHYSLAAYDSNFSTFGHHLDPRAGFVWTPSERTAVRASVGTTFQVPQLTSMYVPPALPPPVGGIVSVGNPNLKPDFATEYDVGGEQIVGGGSDPLHLSADLYRTNLRSGITVPVPPAPPPHCEKRHDCPIVMPINAGNLVYRGIDFRAEKALGSQYRITATWDVGSSFLSTIPPNVQDGTLVAGQQISGDPLHKASLGFERDVRRGWVFGADLDWEGTYNELNRSPYATLDAHVAYRTGRLEIGAYGTNLTNVYANPFTVIGGGVPYGSLPGTPTLPTDAYVLAGAKVVFVVTERL
ncbi:MAG: TonB-dependent receptor [Candidatus Eremiobacteraeota bacterium]|nr:TonB-dependent receptor [Candidatus Eremiobacteraeota bacterium]